MKELLQEFQEGLAWRVEADGVVTVGVTQSALDQAGALQGVDLSDVGDEFNEGDWIAEIRGKDSVVEVQAPFPLRVTERNDEVVEQSSVLEDDPTGDAWLLRVERIDE